MNKKGVFLALIALAAIFSIYQYNPRQSNAELDNSEVGDSVVALEAESVTDTALIARGGFYLIKHPLTKKYFPVTENFQSENLPIPTADKLIIINDQEILKLPASPIPDEPVYGSQAWQPSAENDPSESTPIYIPSSPEEFQNLYPEEFQQIQQEYQWVENQSYYPTLGEFLLGMLFVFLR